MSEDVKLWKYSGPVMVGKFRLIDCSNFEAETYAITKLKALSNLAHQYRMKYGFKPTVSVLLDSDKIHAVPIREKKESTIKYEKRLRTKKPEQLEMIFDELD